MQIPVKKISLLFLMVASGWSQDPAAAAAGAATNAPAAPKEADKNASPALDYLFNKKPQDGTAAQVAAQATGIMGNKFKAADAFGPQGFADQQMAARFDKFLSVVEVPSARVKQYTQLHAKIVGLLKEKKTFEAWKELHVLGEFQEIDAGISRELANRIETIWNADKAAQSMQKKNSELKDQIQQNNWNADVMSDSIRSKELEYQKRANEHKGSGAKGGANPAGPGAPSMPSAPDVSTPDVMGVLGKLQLTEEYLSSLEGKARIKLNEVKVDKLYEQVRADFGEYVSTLYGSRRYSQVILAADFYRKIFDQSEYPVAMANQVNASLEILRDVNAAVDVFQYKSEKGEISNATQRLQEAFAACEFTPSLLEVERSKKEKVAIYLRRMSVMQNLIEAREFGKLEEEIAEVKKLASDFDASKAMALVNGVKLESKMRLGKAKLAAQQGNQQVAMEEFQAAAQAWPGNPDLQTAANLFFDSQDFKSQSLTEFDRLIADQDYRGVYEKQLGFLPAIKGDKKREEQMKGVLEKVKIAETASEKASMLMIAGDVFGAWETVEFAVKDLPDDKKLNRLRAELSGKSAEFIASINKAKEAEAKKEIGYSLTWYVNAQRQYPASQIANEAIERLSKQVLVSSKK